MKRYKIYIPDGAYHYISPFPFLEQCRDEEKAEVILFSGGSDVSPFLYNKLKNRKTYSDMRRDAVEKNVFERNIGKPMIGICRGSQLLTVLNGGSLVQHVTGHATGSLHNIKTFEDKSFQVTSTHHQMMNPFNLNSRDYNILAFAEPELSGTYEGENEKDQIKMFTEPEVVYYPKTKSLAIQWHPEMMDKNDPAVLWIGDIIKKLL